MPPPDDTPLLARLSRASEWWFTPRWRALLTWLALTDITLVVQGANVDRFFHLTQQPIEYLNHFLPAPLPPIFSKIPYGLTLWLLLIWFQPLALRLSLRRGLAWIGVRLIPSIMQQPLYDSLGYHSDWIWYVLPICGSAVLQCLILWRWRSRPWMCLPAQAAPSALVMIQLLRHFGLPYWFRVTVSELPYAALLLYGTRLLRPEERGPRHR